MNPPASDAIRFFTIGHSTRALDDFLRLLRDAGVEVVVDVRKLRGSRRNPQFDEERLSLALPGSGMRYQQVGALGGRRPVSKDVPFDVNSLWHNRSFHNYADHALSNEFREGLDQVIGWGRVSPTAVMCSEAVWWRCHRRIIADHLLARGHEVVHIMDGPRIDEARLTPGAVVHPDARVTYPAVPGSATAG